jgi:hypothetical protein
VNASVLVKTVSQEGNFIEIQGLWFVWKFVQELTLGLGIWLSSRTRPKVRSPAVREKKLILEEPAANTTFLAFEAQHTCTSVHLLL